MNLNPHEEIFKIKPIGIKYICEFCNEGEMKYIANETIMVTLGGNNPRMYKHKCTKCGNTMILPKMYPYIEWVPEDNDQNDN